MIKFLKDLLSSQSDTSSKRFTGMIGFFLTLLFCFGYIITLNHQSLVKDGILILKDIPANVLTLLITILYLCTGLIAAGIFDKLKSQIT
jgi:hypothetical protein